MKICIVSESNYLNDPRPNRLVWHLKKYHFITVIGLNVVSAEDIEVLSYKSPSKRNFLQELQLYLDVLTRNYMRLVKIPSRMLIVQHLQKKEFDIIFCHDLVILPLVIENKKNAKVIFDAREFYPKQQEDNFRWRLLFENFNNWLCKYYLNKVDYMYTVSQGLSERYYKNYKVKNNLIMSFSPYKDFYPSCVNDRVRLIHHGVTNQNRCIHLMIEMMDYIDERFELDLMLVPSQRDYYEKLKEMAQKRNNVKIIEPVPFEQIVLFINQYDIGVFLVPPVTFNLQHCLPNKFFEYIQARLAIAIGPSIEMVKLTKEYDLGVIAKDFTPHSMAEELNKLTQEDIIRYKHNSHHVAKMLSAEENDKKINNIILELL